MVRLWRLTGQRYEASPLDVLAAMGPKYSMLDEFPEEYGEVRQTAAGSSSCHANICAHRAAMQTT